MRKGKLLWGVIFAVVVVTVAVVVAGCAGAEGLQGPPGEAGAPGAPGDIADITCSECHDDTTLVLARQVQWANSTHATGGTFARNEGECAFCHTGEGFVAGEGHVAAGSLSEAEEEALVVENPSPQNCRTCHKIHETYTAADWALTTTAPVTLLTTGDTYDQGNGNLCANCHQNRQYEWAIPQVGGGAVEITSSRYGPHHGPQSNMLLGVGGYGDYSGSKVHYDFVSDGCPVCHMADAYGDQAGGHTFAMGYEYHGSLRPNLAGCESCHSGIESFDRNDVQTDIQALYDQVEALLFAEGLITENGSVVTQTVSSAEAGAIYNWKMVQEDRSLGIHNPGYAEFLLETAIETLQ